MLMMLITGNVALHMKAEQLLATTQPRVFAMQYSMNSKRKPTATAALDWEALDDAGNYYSSNVTVY